MQNCWIFPHPANVLVSADVKTGAYLLPLKLVKMAPF